MRNVSLAVLIAVSLCAAGAAAADWEKPPTFKPGDVLTPELKKGEHHEVKGKVPVESYYYVFELHTDFGELEPVGLDLLRKRVRETAALAALNEVSKTGVFLEAAGRSLEDMGKGLVYVAKDPEGTAKGIGEGIKRFGVNLGRKSKRVYEDATSDDENKKETSSGEKAESVANAALGVNKAARIWAKKLQVDPYSRNPILQEALLAVAKIDAAGGIATKVVVPVPTVVSATSTAGDLVWGQDPEAVRKANEAGLKALGVSDEIAGELLRNKAFTLTDHTRFVTALTAVKAEGLADYCDTARWAKTHREALFFVESAEMLRRQHKEAPVKKVLTDSNALVALSGGRGVALLPLDHVAWTERVSEVSAEVAERAKTELGAKGLQMQVSGKVSSNARTGLQGLGWAVQEGASLGSPSGK
jgi:hypothetical protein